MPHKTKEAAQAYYKRRKAESGIILKRDAEANFLASLRQARQDEIAGIAADQKRAIDRMFREVLL